MTGVMESAESLSCLICVFAYLINYSNGLTYYVPEEQPRTTLIGNIAKDEDIRSLVSQEQFNSLNFYFLDLENKYLKYFAINSSSSDLSIKEPLDREVICEFSPALACEVSVEVATQSKIGTFFKKISVKVVIEDINDHPPKFASNLLNLRLSESEVSGKFIAIDGAVDKDSFNNSVKKYTIVPSNVPFIAEFNPDNPSELRLVINGQLDRETVANYYFTIVATDGGKPPLNGSIMVNVTIEDTNDNRPVFTQNLYRVTVNESYPSNVTFLKVTATDLDIGENAKITYRINSQQTQDIMDTYKINSTSGEVYLARRLLYISREPIRVKIDAVDNGERPLTSQTVVEVTVEDSENNAPIININLLSSSSYAETSEYATYGFVVAYVEVTDYDGDRNGLVECSVDKTGFFSLQAVEAKEYKVIVAGRLDRETIEKHNVTIYCNDFGIPGLTSSANFTVVVLDENDNPPMFSEKAYKANVLENNKNGSTIIQVYARDPDLGQNGQVSYFLAPDLLKNFSINAKTGLITANIAFDRETKLKYDFVVLAVDAGNPPLSSAVNVSVTIDDVNDNAPKFTEDRYEYYIPENQSKSKETVLGKLVANDKDSDGNGYVSYSLVGNYSELPFEVLPDGTLKSLDVFDREKVAQFDFKVMAIDNGIELRLSSVVNVTVHVTDINDNSPVIVYPSEPNVVKYITYMMPAQTQIMKIEANDADEGKNAELSFSITKRNDSKMFEMGRNGEIYVARRLTAADVENYFLEITVADQGIPSRQDVTSVTIVVLMKNVTDVAASEGGIDKTNIIIAVVVVVVTVIIAAVILIVIWIVRRHDLQKRKIMSTQGNHHGDNDSGFSSTGGRKSPAPKIYQNGLVPSVPFLTPMTLERPESKPKDVTFQETVHVREKSLDSSSETGNHTVELHRLASLRLQQALIQNNNNKQWTSQTELLQDGIRDGKKQEDHHSDLSADTATYDSGIGGSVSDTGDLRINQLQQLVKQNGRRGQPPHKMQNGPSKPPKIIARGRTDSDVPPERPPPLKNNPYKAKSPVQSPIQFSHAGSPSPSLYATSSPTPCSTNQRSFISSPSPTKFTIDRHSPSKSVVQDLLMYKKFQNGLKPTAGRLTVDESVDTTHIDDDGSTTSGSYYIDNPAEDWQHPPVSDIYV